jgi:hypothetical protein
MSLHVSTPLPEHCVEPGEHTPVQLPVTQAFVQVWFPPQAPVASQVCATFVGLVGSQRLLAGTQVPVQVPGPEHTKGQGVPVSCQLPVASQT